MKRSLGMLILAGFPVTVATFHQGGGQDIRLVRDQPAIYLTYERRGRAIDIGNSRIAEIGQNARSREPGRDIWLRLHNNSRWAVSFPTWSMYLEPSLPTDLLSSGRRVWGIRDNTEVNAKYEVAEQDGKHVAYGGDTSATSWLPAGRSVLFSVKSEHLSRGRSVFLYFGYEWEDGQNYSNNLAPEHRVMYWGFRLQSDEKKE